MHGSPATLQQAVVDGVADQGVREPEGVPSPPNETIRCQEVRGVTAEQVGQRARLGALAENRARLQYLLVFRRESVDLFLNQALHRAWYAGLGALRRLVDEVR